MNPLLVEFLSSLARFGLAYVAGFLTHHKVIDENEASKYVQAASGWLVITGLTAAPLAWSLFKAHVLVRLKKEAKENDKAIEVAIASPPETTVSEVKEIAGEIGRVTQ